MTTKERNARALGHWGVMLAVLGVVIMLWQASAEIEGAEAGPAALLWIGIVMRVVSFYWTRSVREET